MDSLKLKEIDRIIEKSNQLATLLSREGHLDLAFNQAHITSELMDKKESLNERIIEEEA